jgi:tripartite-type tricarboxylate transporter receptor subunit TctC
LIKPPSKQSKISEKLNMKHTQLLMSLIAALSITLTSQAQAQVPSGYPNKPIRMILPLAVGSAVDVASQIACSKNVYQHGAIHRH